MKASEKRWNPSISYLHYVLVSSEGEKPESAVHRVENHILPLAFALWYQLHQLNYELHSWCNWYYNVSGCTCMHVIFVWGSYSLPFKWNVILLIENWNLIVMNHFNKVPKQLCRDENILHSLVTSRRPITIIAIAPESCFTSKAVPLILLYILLV